MTSADTIEYGLPARYFMVISLLMSLTHANERADYSILILIFQGPFMKKVIGNILLVIGSVGTLFFGLFPILDKYSPGAIEIFSNSNFLIGIIGWITLLTLLLAQTDLFLGITSPAGRLAGTLIPALIAGFLLGAPLSSVIPWLPLVLICALAYWIWRVTETDPFKVRYVSVWLGLFFLIGSILLILYAATFKK